MSQSVEMSIRNVERSDAEALREIYNYAVRQTTATMDVDDRTTETQLAWIAAHNGSPYAGIVAVVGEAVVGYASLSPINPRPGYRPTVENSLYVHPDWHGRGVGRKLLAELIERAAAMGFHSIVALISADNEASLRVHRAQGFVEAGLLKEVGRKHGQWVDVAYLQLILGERGEES